MNAFQWARNISANYSIGYLVHGRLSCLADGPAKKVNDRWAVRE